MLPWLLTLCIALPWLNPFAPPPSAYVVPWLVTGFLGAAALLLVAIRPFSRTQITGALAWGWLIAGGVSACIGLTQYHGWAVQLSAEFSGWINAGNWGEAYGHLRQRNLFATLTNIALVSALYLAATRASRAAKPVAPLSLWAWGAVVLLLTAGNAASGSRTGLLQLLLLCLGSLVVLKRHAQPNRWWLPAAWALSSYLVWMWALPHTLGALSTAPPTAWARMAESGGCENRLVLWFNVLELISQKPWLGWGWGELDWAHHMAVYRWDAFGGPHRFCALLDNAHNVFLHVAVEGGLLLAVTLSLWCGWLVWRNQPWREHNPQRLLAWVVLFLIGLHSMLEYPLWYGPFVTATLCCLLILLPSGLFAPAHRARWVAGGVGVCVLSLCVYWTWDYHRVSQYFLPAESRNPWTEHKPLALADPSGLFQSQLDFARLLTLTVTAENAAQTQALALRTLHYSPEPKVIEQLLVAALLTGDEDLYRLHAARYQQSYPDAYAKWRSAALSSRAEGASRE
jgi:Virulence factor membrane-bound polymerase, C-terminal/O-Antigen ligase/Protein glycosylation ligase